MPPQRVSTKNPAQNIPSVNSYHYYPLNDISTASQGLPLSVGFSRQEFANELPFPPPGIFPTQGPNLCLLHWQVDSLCLSHLGSPCKVIKSFNFFKKKNYSYFHRNYHKCISIFLEKWLEYTTSSESRAFLSLIFRYLGNRRGCEGNGESSCTVWASATSASFSSNSQRLIPQQKQGI